MEYLSSILSLVLVIIIIGISLYYFLKPKTINSGSKTINYGTFTDLLNKNHIISELPVSIEANNINAEYPGCTRNACPEGKFLLNGYITNKAGQHTALSNITTGLITVSNAESGNVYNITLSNSPKPTNIPTFLPLN